MFGVIMKYIGVYFIEKYAADAVELGARKLVESTDNGIDDKLLEVFLDEAVKSKRNNLTSELKQVIINKIRE